MKLFVVTLAIEIIFWLRFSKHIVCRKIGIFTIHLWCYKKIKDL